MVKASEIEMYLCPKCGEEHDTEEDAWNCCPDKIFPETRYQCSECDEIYEEEFEAEQCCREEEKDDEPSEEELTDEPKK